MDDNEDDVKPDACESCDWETDDLKRYAMRPGRPAFWFCEVCAGTMAGNAHAYPQQHENKEVLAAIAWGINYLAKVIREGRTP